VSLSCTEARGRLDDYAAEALGSTDRRELREHLAGCPPCRGEAVRSDPGLLFCGVDVEEVSEADLARVLSGVRAGIALKQAQSRLDEGLVGAIRKSRGGGRRRSGLVAAAAIVALTLVFPETASRRPQPGAAAHFAKFRATSEGPPSPAVRPEAVPSAETPNSKFPADATIYDWNSGSGEPRVVWIVDQSLDI